MYVIEWAERRDTVWTGQGYCEAPWLARKYETPEDAEARAARIGGVVVPWQERRKVEKPPDDCPF